MKSLTGFFLAIIFSLSIVLNVNAQGAESIWLAADTASYKTGDTVIVTVNAASATPIQGFTFQVRYDPDCLRPVNAASTVPGMNGLPLPQLTGQVDGSYASTTPQVVNGVLAEIRFTALRGCQTNLTLESAALAIRNQSGFAAPLTGVTIGETTLALAISMETGASQSVEAPAGAILPLDPPAPAKKTIPVWVMGLVAALLTGGALGGVLLVRRKPTAKSKPAIPYRTPTLQMKRGPYAGKDFVLNKVPFLIGRDPKSDICLNDPNISGQHAKIFTANDAYYLMDMGGGTFINGQAIKRSPALLKPGDVVRLGKSALLVFES